MAEGVLWRKQSEDSREPYGPRQIMMRFARDRSK